jgi:penicillin-binding protein 1A
MNDKNKNSSTKKPVTSLSTGENKKYTVYFWILSLFPFFIVTSLFLFQSEDDLPPVELLDNPPEIQASLIIAKKSEKEDTVIGRFWLVNRTSVKYRQISPFVIDALIATEDERFMSHSGIDFKGFPCLFTVITGSPLTIARQTLTSSMVIICGFLTKSATL